MAYHCFRCGFASKEIDTEYEFTKCPECGEYSYASWEVLLDTLNNLYLQGDFMPLQMEGLKELEYEEIINRH